MIHLKKFVFNPFSENTYIIYDDAGACIIIDPGCYYPEEKEALSSFIAEQELAPQKIVLTHGHLDHIFGCAYISDTYKIPIQAHAGTNALIRMMPQISSMYGIPSVPSPEATLFLEESDVLTLGTEVFQVLFCPGHSPDSLVYYHEKQGFLLGGDVLFQRSIGRTDLPGGNHEALLRSIREKLWPLPPETIVYSGHGEETTIGEEKQLNPFLS